MSRNLNFCFIKIKSLSSSSPEHTLPENHSRPFSSSSLLFKNYNSLYQNSDDSDSNSAAAAAASTPDIATVFASRRFFFSSPGRSNSIIDSTSSISSTSSTSSSLNLRPPNADAAAIAVPTYSPDPFIDFRRSMQEMVAARGIHDVSQNWDYLHELLMCYLSLNPKPTHKFIVGAFADLLVTLMVTPPESGRRKTPFTDGKRKISR